ncbi:CHAD domain-containing protein [Streptomyces gobiensis]|uniref:CHAD domain-containing protein n=1 Tax=Streptomyces gobiensis TaxID=2875706 RepID=UPI0030D333D4
MTRVTAGEALAGYLNGQAAELLRSLRLHDENAGSADTAAEATEAIRVLRRAARRINGTLHTFRPLLDADWAERFSAELGWLSGLLAREYAYAARLSRLLAALHRLSAPADGHGSGQDSGIGAARAGALLERQLTLSRTRAHSAALRALGSARFHAVADGVAVLASEAPVDAKAAERPASAVMRPLAELAHRCLIESVDALPLGPGALAHTLAAAEERHTTEGGHDTAWHQVRRLVRLVRYAQEALGAAGGDSTALVLASHHLNRHRDAAGAAAAAAAAGRTPRIAPATAYALGVLHADQRHEVEAARLAFCRIWHPRGEAAHG